MSEPNEPRKISYDTLVEKAREWWDRQIGRMEVENLIIELYMNEHGITDNMIDV